VDPKNRITSAHGLSVAGAGAEVRLQFITFTLDAQDYGVDIMAVREIKGWSETTSIPNAPRFISGVINLRGTIVPIMDLRARFSMELTKPTKMHVVIIINTGARTTGLLVDAVSDIISVAPEAIRPVPEMGGGGQESLLTGLVALDDRMVSLVSLAGLIGAGDLRLPPTDTLLQPAA
jgi:purine-binding chemotaxis protein CheW